MCEGHISEGQIIAAGMSSVQGKICFKLATFTNDALSDLSRISFDVAAAGFSLALGQGYLLRC